MCCNKKKEKKLTTYVVCTILSVNVFFIVRFYAIIHRTTIVQNIIISSICSCSFFVH